MAELFRLPKMGQTMTEATILKWLKQEGDTFQGWEAIVEMMTDKINMEVEPQITGTLRKILAPEGAVVPLGGALAIIGAPAEDITALLREAELRAGIGEPAAGVGEQTAARGASAAGAPPATGVFPPAAFPPVSPRAREAITAAGQNWKEWALPGTGADGLVIERDVRAALARQAPPAPVRVTPLAARLASDLGVPLEGVAGSGPAGRIQADDVRRRAAPRTASPPIAAREIPLQGMRRVIAQRLSASYQQAVHVPLRVDVDMSAAAELRRQLKPALEDAAVRLTYTDLIAAAVVQALIAQPLLNATLEDDRVRIHPGVHLGIAVALDEGLLVPVVRDAHAHRLPGLSAAIQDVAARARAGALPPDGYSGGTFTITNLGQFGVDSFDPILNPPQVGILGVGAIRDRVVAHQGAPAVRPTLTLTLTFDHRALDGAPAGQFLGRVRELLENPARLLL